MKFRYNTLPLMALVLVPLFIFSGLSLSSKTVTEPGSVLSGSHVASHMDSRAASNSLQFQTGEAVAAKTDTVTILKTQWQPRKRRKFRVIVIANTNAKLGSVKLH